MNGSHRDRKISVTRQYKEEKNTKYEGLSDDEKMDLLNKYFEEGEYYGAAEIIASMSSDDKKIELFEKRAHRLYEGQQDGIDYRTIIAEGIVSDEKKLELIEKHRKEGLEYWYLERVIASLQSDDKKIELGGDSPVVIASLSTDDKKIEQFAENWEHMDDGERSIVITSLHSDMTKLKLLKIIEKEWNKGWIVETLISDEKKLELLEEFSSEDTRTDVIASLGNAANEISDLETETEISEHTETLVNSIVQGYFERKERFKENDESVAYTLGEDALQEYREGRKQFEARFALELRILEQQKTIKQQEKEIAELKGKEKDK